MTEYSEELSMKLDMSLDDLIGAETITSKFVNTQNTNENVTNPKKRKANNKGSSSLNQNNLNGHVSPPHTPKGEELSEETQKTPLTDYLPRPAKRPHIFRQIFQPPRTNARAPTPNINSSFPPSFDSLHTPPSRGFPHEIQYYHNHSLNPLRPPLFYPPYRPMQYSPHLKNFSLFPMIPFRGRAPPVSPPESQFWKEQIDSNLIHQPPINLEANDDHNNPHPPKYLPSAHPDPHSLHPFYTPQSSLHMLTSAFHKFYANPPHRPPPSGIHYTRPPPLHASFPFIPAVNLTQLQNTTPNQHFLPPFSSATPSEHTQTPLLRPHFLRSHERRNEDGAPRDLSSLQKINTIPEEDLMISEPTTNDVKLAQIYNEKILIDRETEIQASQQPPFLPYPPRTLFPDKLPHASPEYEVIGVQKTSKDEVYYSEFKPESSKSHLTPSPLTLPSSNIDQNDRLTLNSRSSPLFYSSQLPAPLPVSFLPTSRHHEAVTSNSLPTNNISKSPQNPTDNFFIKNHTYNHTYHQKVNNHQNSRSPDKLPSASRSSGYNVIVTNVPHNLTAVEIQEAFSCLGKILRTDIMLTSHGEHTGRVSVMFDSKSAASQAVERYDGGDLNGNTVRVFRE